MRRLPHESSTLTDAIPPRGSRVVLFWPLPDEVDTRPFIRACQEVGTEVLLPVVIDEDIELRIYTGESCMKAGRFGIMEPQGESITDYTNISRIYVPGMAFTSDGKRLGRGRGYYDRFLAKIVPLCRRTEIIGVCPKGHLVEYIPTEPHDFRMQRVITFSSLIFLVILILLPSCGGKAPVPTNEAFTEVMDTTGASDPYAYDADNKENEEAQIARVQQSWRLRHDIKRSVRAPFINKEKGIISVYDDLFRTASTQTGWDWRLIAAQCYQESGFDPQAVSRAGARGLMQIMPGTAKELGLSMNDVHSPEANLAAASKYICQLSALFSDIKSSEERIHFVLAAYNGGYKHIRDAMALTKKYGGNPQRWENVSAYVLALQQPKYYRDPVVKYGYMIGSETAGYVSSIVQRARQYGANMSAVSLPPGWQEFTVSTDTTTATSTKRKDTSRKQNKFTGGTPSVMTPEQLSLYQQ